MNYRFIVVVVFIIVVIIVVYPLSFNPIPHGGRILWLPRQGVLKTPLGYQERSYFRPHIVESYFETNRNRDHLRKFGAKSKKLSKISGF